MPDYMRYSGETVEIFAWTPAGQPVPRLRSHAVGEQIGDQAFVDGLAMSWDGDAWRAMLWKDFAVWKKADVAPKRRASDVADHQIDLVDLPAETMHETHDSVH
jgi:hypothetical protein